MKVRTGCRLLVSVFISGTLLINAVLSAAAYEQSFDVGAAERPSVNTQPRHKVCTSLSEAAQSYYKGDYSYSALSRLSGASAIASSESATHNNELYDALHKLMADTHKNYTSYSGYNKGSLAYYWISTDAVSGGDTYNMFYSDVSANDEGIKLNREHIWPKSRASFQTSGGGSDLHHLRPSVDTLNSAKSNHSFGYIHDTFSVNVKEGRVEDKLCYWVSPENDLFECKDDVKGDVARILLYVYCRWQQPNLYSDVPETKLPAFDADDSVNSGLKVVESLDTLLYWCAEDPVDTWEMTRNDLIQQIQGNRNVFIDYPALAWQIFGKNPPSSMSTPTRQGCEHCYSEASRTPAECEINGRFVLRCSICGNKVRRRIAHNGHTDVQKDGFCDICGIDCMISADVKQTESISEGDSVILYHPSSISTLSRFETSNGKLESVNISLNESVVRYPSESAMFRIKMTGNGSFYLISDGKYLTSSETGEKLFYSKTPEKLSEWKTESTDGFTVYIKNTGAYSDGSERYLEYYRGNFTTYKKDNSNNFKIQLYLISPDNGDINGDGKININDATAIQKHLAMISTVAQQLIKSADMNHDGRVNIDDVTLVQMRIAQINNSN